MNILVSNDDGLDCEGVTCLTAELRAKGHRVLAVVPDRNRSGASHSVTFESRLTLRKTAPDTWVYGGTPVDCVLSALVRGGFEFKPDIVVSGINAGANLGTDILYSGTAAAARQGSLYDFPSIAFSVDGNEPYQFDRAARWSADNLETLLKIWRKDTFVNVNYPNSPSFSAFMVTYPSVRVYEDLIRQERAGEDMMSFALAGAGVNVHEDSRRRPSFAGCAVSDWEAVRLDKVSVSIIYNHPRVPEDSLCLNDGAVGAGVGADSTVGGAYGKYDD